MIPPHDENFNPPYQHPVPRANLSARLLADTPDAIIYQDNNQRLIWFNPSSSKESHQPSEELREEYCYRFFKLDSPCPQCPVYEARKTARKQYRELKTPDGKWWLILGAPLVDGNGTLTGVVETALDISQQKLQEQQLKKSQEHYHLIAENTVEAILVLQGEQIKYFNQAAVDLLGYPQGELLSEEVKTIIHPQDRMLVENRYQGRMQGEEVPSRYEVRIITPQGETRWVEIKAVLIEWEDEPAILSFLTDITDRIKSEEDLNRQKMYLEALFTNSPEAIALLDREKHIMNINRKFTELFGYSLKEVKGKNIDDLLCSSQEKEQARLLSEITMQGENVQERVVRYAKDGQPINVSVKGVPIFISGDIVGIYGIYSDISEQKHYEEQLRYFSFHDSLTGLYNRTFFEEELHRLEKSREYPIAFLSADLDGLKLINDTMGHQVGDVFLKNCAHIIKTSLRREDILARVGGDEFAALLIRTGEEEVKKIAQRIRERIEEFNREHPEKPLSISLGYAVAPSSDFPLEDAYRQSDDRMYQDKLLQSTKIKSQIVETLLRTLSSKDSLDQGHAERLEELSRKMGHKLNLDSRQLNNLSLLSQVHDLGKVSIPEEILFKEDSLTREEWDIIRQHSEKGYRIALSSPDLAGVAELILKHHERWDGQGYPLGLRENEIPVECRILNIVDAYDAMTSTTPYRQAMPHHEAVKEIKAQAGKQFDPYLAKIFLEILEEREAS